jgi:large subunit ribosomal protein L1
MGKLSKNMKRVQAAVVAPEESAKAFAVGEAISQLIENSFVKFDASCDLCIGLNIDTRKTDQAVRGASYLPNGTGRVVKIAAFGSGVMIDEAREAGADFVGLDDLIDRVKKDGAFFDICIASPDAMAKLKDVARILGPRGLMPNPKLGTVTEDFAGTVKKIKAGVVEYRADKAGFVNCTIGKLSFGVEKLVANFEFIIKEIIAAKPLSSKGVFLKSVLFSSTMGPGLKVNISDVVRRNNESRG